MDLTPEQWVQYLVRRHEAELPQLHGLNSYYEGSQPLAYMHPELLAELGDQIKQLVINWPRLVVDAVEERLDVEGFRYPDAETGDKDLWALWQDNGLDEASQQAHVDALVMRRSYLIVGSREGDPSTPLITAESPLQVFADYDPATRKVRAAMKRWHDVDGLTGAVRDQFLTLYLPDSTRHYAFQGQQGGWTETESSRDEHGLGEVPVVTLANRGRLLVPGGVTELADVLPVSDAACKIATDMMIASEFHAMPRRWALGFDQDDFTDADGAPISVWSRLAGRIWATAKNKKDDGVEVGQFPEAELKNFHSTIEILARIVSALAALPPNYMGLSADDAASDAAIRSREARLVKRAERKTRSWSGSYEQAMRLATRIRDGEWDPRTRRLETMWRDPATPTYAQKADAVTKLHGAGILPTEQAWEDLGYTAAQQSRMRQMQSDALNRAVGGDMAALFGPKVAPEPEPDPEPQ